MSPARRANVDIIAQEETQFYRIDLIFFLNNIKARKPKWLAGFVSFLHEFTVLTKLL